MSSVEETNTADVIVVGGGIIGCATAYNLAKKGSSVIVLEAQDIIGNGGSCRNGGGVRQSGRDPRELPLAMYAVKNLWPSLSEELDCDVEYRQAGNLRLGKTGHHLEILQGLTDRATALGLDVRMISGDEVREINPYLSDEVIGASWCPTDGHANPLRATMGFYRAARKLGARFYTGQPVVELRKVRGRLRRVVTATDAFEADRVVVAAGYASRKILNTVDIDVPVSEVLIECLVTEAEPPMFGQMLGTADADFYGHQTKHGSFVFGGASGYEDFNGCVDEGRISVSAMTAPAECRAILRWIPDLAHAKVVRTWAGYEDTCADGVPVLGKVEEVPGLVVACGFTGHGFGISPVVGQLLAEVARDEEPALDLSAFRYDRFKPAH